MIMDFWYLYYFASGIFLIVMWVLIIKEVVGRRAIKNTEKLVELYLDSLQVYLYKNDDEAAAGAMLIFHVFGK